MNKNISLVIFLVCILWGGVIVKSADNKNSGNSNNEKQFNGDTTENNSIETLEKQLEIAEKNFRYYKGEFYLKQQKRLQSLPQPTEDDPFYHYTALTQRDENVRNAIEDLSISKIELEIAKLRLKLAKTDKSDERMKLSDKINGLQIKLTAKKRKRENSVIDNTTEPKKSNSAFSQAVKGFIHR